MRECNGKSIRQPFVGAALVCILSIAYVLSYAPIVRATGGWTTRRVPNFTGKVVTISSPVCGLDLPLYRPVEWLIDNTPLRGPLLKWAGLWGVTGQPLTRLLYAKPADADWLGDAREERDIELIRPH